MLIAKTGGGLKTKKRKKAFTLIELLAIIVILAIIAVITVPIILNIIDNSKKGAATDSAYGYKDAVNKWYVQELAKPNNENLKLDKTYTVESDGKLTGKFEGDESSSRTVTIDISGTVPTGGSLTYSNNVLTSGYLVIGDYTATYSNGSFTAVKTSAASNEPAVDPYSISITCQNCIYMSPDDGGSYRIGETAPSSQYVSNDYTTFGKTFLAMTVEQNVITRVFVCGYNDNNQVFCLEGYEGTNASKYARNVDIVNHFYPMCNAETEAEENNCNETYNPYIKNNGYVYIKNPDNVDHDICTGGSDTYFGAGSGC